MDLRRNDIDDVAKQTCSWMLDHEKFLAWQTERRGLLWISGKPGVGKSTILKHILQVNSLHNPGNALLLSFFFHGRGSDLQKTAEGFYRSVIYQMLSQAPNACSDLMTSYTENCRQKGEPFKGWRWHIQELRDFFVYRIYSNSKCSPSESLLMPWMSVDQTSQTYC